MDDEQICDTVKILKQDPCIDVSSLLQDIEVGSKLVDKDLFLQTLADKQGS